MPYGEHQALMAQERTAPMSQADSIKPANVPSAPPARGGAPPQLTPLDAPSARPDEPITHGVDIGDGGGSDVIAAASPTRVQPGRMTAMLAELASRDVSGVLASLYQSALATGA
jgi:hypothetical protein